MAYGKCGYTHLEDKADMVGRDQAWLLNGVEVAQAWRRKGIAHRLVQYRLDWLTKHTDLVLYSTSLDNHASVALHQAFGFIPYPQHMPAKSRKGMVVSQWFYLPLSMR